MYRPLVRLFAFALTTPNYVGAPPGHNSDVVVARLACAVVLGSACALVVGVAAAVRWGAGAIGIWP